MDLKALIRQTDGKVFLDAFVVQVTLTGPNVDGLKMFTKSDGAEAYYFDGRLHRDDGPAYKSDQYCAWFTNGKLHRNDGPAVLFLNSEDGFLARAFYIHEQDISEQVERWLKTNPFMPINHEDWNDSHKMFFKLTFGS